MRRVLVLVALFACSKSEPSKEAPPPTTSPPPTPAPAPVVAANPPDATAPVADAATSVGTAERERIADRLRSMVGADLASKVSIAGNTLVFDAHLGDCDGRHLMSYWRQLKAAGADPSKAFDLFGCAELGDVVDLHSKDHCRPEDTDSLILTDAGDARDRWLEKEAMTFFKSGVQYVVSTGCDETVVAMVNTADFTCDAGALQKVKAKIGAQLVPHGFLRLWCQPDGPYLSLK